MKNVKFNKEMIPILIGIAIILGLSFSNLNAQCCSMKGHSGHSDHDSHAMQNKNSADTSLIRKGNIDVYEIDFDMDGHVYQDQMHWNVISDKPGKCPICGMELEKVKNKKAIKNLKENDFTVKE